MNTKNLKIWALVAYFSLLIFMPTWLIWLSPSALSTPVILAFFVVPLLFPLKGLVTGTPYTYAWANFIIMINFLHSLTTLWVMPSDRIYALVELLLTSVFFISASYYAKYRGQELGLSIRKKKDVNNEKVRL